jgi:hypothetical protein
VLYYTVKTCQGQTPAYFANGKQSTVNKSLDGSMYPGKKLAHSALGKKIINVKNATAYTLDWYCHLVVDRASLVRYNLNIVLLLRSEGPYSQNLNFFQTYT